MKILSIGNSFSDDAHTYLHRIAVSQGCDLYTLNLNIGGCSLERHYNNMKSNAKDYMFQENGVITDRMIGIEEALLLEKWDVITIQQVSAQSFIEDSYYPYINELAEYIRSMVPGAKLLIHETWAYEDGSEMIKKYYGDGSSEKMHADLKKAYTRAKNEINADAIIPSGDMFIELKNRARGKIHRDTFHASYGLGRYALALLWYRSLTGRSVLDVDFSDLDEPISIDDMNAAKTLVESFGKII